MSFSSLCFGEFHNPSGIQLLKPPHISRPGFSAIFGGASSPYLLGSSPGIGRAPDKEPAFLFVLPIKQEEPNEGWARTEEFVLEFNEGLRYFAATEEPWKTDVSKRELVTLEKIKASDGQPAKALFLSQTELKDLVAAFRRRNYRARTKRETKEEALSSPFSPRKGE